MESVHLIHKIRKRCDKWNDNFAAKCENGCLSAPTLLLIKQYITLSAMPNFSSIHATPMVIEVVLSALKCKLFFRGRPECPKVQAVFNITCDRLEIEIDLFTLEDFQLKMEEVSSDEVYSVKKIKQKLQEKYKENIFFAEVSRRKNVVSIRSMHDWIISNQWYDNKRQNADDEVKHIFETAAKIIKNELKKCLQSNATGSISCYPSIDDVKTGLIPYHLRLILVPSFFPN